MSKDCPHKVVYYNQAEDNFYCSLCSKGMGVEFYKKYISRFKDFLQPRGIDENGIPEDINAIKKRLTEMVEANVTLARLQSDILMEEKKLEMLKDYVSEAEVNIHKYQLAAVRIYFSLKLKKNEFMALHMDDIEIGYHYCEYSPIKTCFYNHKEDTPHDDCLICGLPDERK